MAKYALTDDGLAILKDRAFREKLSPYQRDIFNQAIEKLKEEILVDPEKAKRGYLSNQSSAQNFFKKNHIPS